MFIRKHNTLRVSKSTPRVSTSCVESEPMKTIGERIRQAREALKISGDALAKKAGYKNQSAIGNLENRAGGTGGNKIGVIADALNVSVEWLLRGPDCDVVPFIVPAAPPGTNQNPTQSTVSAISMGSITPRQAWGIVGKLIAEADDLTRDQVKPLLARMCDEPGRIPEILKRIESALDAGNENSVTESQPKSISSGHG
jgi:hypothetical protein